jgi:hypothetical protein
MYLSRSRALMPAENQREHVSLLLGQRRQIVYHPLDPSVQVVLIIAASSNGSAAIARSRWGAQ